MPFADPFNSDINFLLKLDSKLYGARIDAQKKLVYTHKKSCVINYLMR